MNKLIKFYPNHPDNMHCSQAVFRSLFKYFFNEELSWEEIDKISNTIQGRGSWTLATYIELANRGVEIINIEPFDYKKYYQEGINYLKNNFDKNTVDYYINKSNLLQIKNLIPIFLKKIKHTTKKATIQDIDNLIKKNYLIGAEINSRVLNKKDGFSLHYVLITHKDKDNYYINDPGGGSSPPLKQRQVSKTDFIKALGGKTTNGEITGFKK